MITLCEKKNPIASIVHPGSTIECFFLHSPIVNGSTVLKSVDVALILGEEEEHAFQYLARESNDTMWPGIEQ